MPGVFISYRREDSAGQSGRLFDRLRAALGPDRVFMDVTGIEAGVDFVDTIEQAIGSCELVLAVIGPEWLTCAGPNGRQRLQDPADFIRLEIASALKRKIRVIPVLVAGASMPTADALPEDLQPLARRQATELRDTRWDADAADLTALIQRIIGVEPAPVADTRPRVNMREEYRRQRRPLRFALGAGLLTAAILLALGWALGLFPPTREQHSAPAASSSTIPQVSSPAGENAGKQTATSQATPPKTAPRPTSSAQPNTTASTGSPATGKADPSPSPTEKPAAEIPVPDMKGIDVAEASRVLGEAGLRLGQIQARSGVAARPGMIVDQRPAAGTLVARGTLVDVSHAVPQQVRLPKVVGMDVRAAMDRLFGEGLKVRREPQSTSGATPGVVLDQDPPPGASLNVGSTVRLVYAVASQPPGVPKVTGLQVREAIDTLKRAGLGVQILREFTTRVTEGEVMRQLPAAGVALSSADAPVVLTVATVPPSTANYLVSYNSPIDQDVAEKLASFLRASMKISPRLRRFARQPSNAGEIVYYKPELEGTARTIAPQIGSWLSRLNGQRVTVTTRLDTSRPGDVIEIVLPTAF